MNKKVSVIIPIYNKEKYLDKCIKSIICQTYKNIEIILINDGSSDNSLYICQKYNDERIIIINQLNQGVSAARNKGLNIAKGDYICFVDSDDYIDKNYIKIMVANINGFDMCECGIKYITNKKTNTYWNPINKKEFDNYEIEKNFLLLDNSTDYICNKFFSRKCVNNNRFDKKYKCSEDFEFITRVLKKVNSKNTINKTHYNYNINIDSIGQEKFSDKKMDVIFSRIKAFENYNLNEKYELRNIVALQILSRIISIYFIADKKNKKILKNNYNYYYNYAIKIKEQKIKRLLKYTYYLILINIY